MGAKPEETGPVPGWAESQDADPSPASPTPEPEDTPSSRGTSRRPGRTTEAHHSVPWTASGVDSQNASPSLLPKPLEHLPADFGTTWERSWGVCCWTAELPTSLDHCVSSQVTPRDEHVLPASLAHYLPLLSTWTSPWGWLIEKESTGSPTAPQNCGSEGLSRTITVWGPFVQSPDIGSYLHTGFSQGLLKARDRSDGRTGRKEVLLASVRGRARDASHRAQGGLTP